MKHLGFQKTSYILVCQDPCICFIEVFPNFPNVARGLSKIVVHPSFRREVEDNSKGKESMLSLNGIAVDLSLQTFNFFELLNLIEYKMQLVTQWKSIGKFKLNQLLETVLQ